MACAQAAFTRSHWSIKSWRSGIMMAEKPLPPSWMWMPCGNSTHIYGERRKKGPGAVVNMTFGLILKWNKPFKPSSYVPRFSSLKFFQHCQPTAPQWPQRQLQVQYFHISCVLILNKFARRKRSYKSSVIHIANFCLLDKLGCQNKCLHKPNG